MSSRLPVVLLWHMHQPQYRDALSGQYVLPWTYLHAIKDYTDMAAHLEAVPAARAVVNFTPVLIEQLEEIAACVAQHLEAGSPLPDPVLALLGPDPVPRDPNARLELMRACLRAQRKQMIERFGPYLELATLAEMLATTERVAYASNQLIQDLAVWYHLAWLGETVRRGNPLVTALSDQGRGFTAEQRRDLLALIGKELSAIVPRYRRLCERGQCELSMSPYGHPIVPLLLDFQSAREAVPSMPLPQHGAYPGGSERAAWHVEEGLRVFQRAFGVRPVGCWPSEGAISRGTLELLDRFQFRWAASSTNVLRATLASAASSSSGAGDHSGAGGNSGNPVTSSSAATASTDPLALNRPYRAAGSGLNVFFRDDGLSDLIGFTYATWHGDDAAQNLVNQLAELARRYGDAPNHAPNHAVLIALDGENAWEHYPFNGYYFLQALYTNLANHPLLQLTTLSDCLAGIIAPAPLPRVIAGSWVHGTLATWMGDSDKNRAWDLLCEAKLAFDRSTRQGALGAQQQVAAERQLALCESSDWFWWFGDYNPQEAVTQFDQLFRRQLVNLYRLLGLTPPTSLAEPISAGRGAPEHGGVMRRANAG